MKVLLKGVLTSEKNRQLSLLIPDKEIKSFSTIADGQAKTLPVTKSE